MPTTMTDDFQLRLQQAWNRAIQELQDAPIHRRALIAMLARHLSDDGGPPPNTEQFELIAERVDIVVAGGPKSEQEERREERTWFEEIECAVRDVLALRSNKPATTGALHELTGGMGSSNVRHFGAVLHALAGDGKLCRESGVSRAGRRYYLWSLPEADRSRS